MRRCLDQAFVLHSMPYRESSAVVRLLTSEHGVVSGVARGVYQSNRKGQQLRAALQLGSHLEWQWHGDGSLKNIQHCELLQHPGIHHPRQLICLSYINELLLHFLPAEQPAPALYQAYTVLLEHIRQQDDLEMVLREYEQLLFEEMGCVIDFLWDQQNDQPVCQGRLYRLHPEQGITEDDGSGQGLLLNSEQLHQLAERDFTCTETRRLSKRVNRLMIDHYLEGKPLKARALYRQL